MMDFILLLTSLAWGVEFQQNWITLLLLMDPSNAEFLAYNCELRLMGKSTLCQKENQRTVSQILNLQMLLDHTSCQKKSSNNRILQHWTDMCSLSSPTPSDTFWSSKSFIKTIKTNLNCVQSLVSHLRWGDNSDNLKVWTMFTKILPRRKQHMMRQPTPTSWLSPVLNVIYEARQTSAIVFCCCCTFKRG